MGRVDAPGKLDECNRNAIGHDLVKAAAERFSESALALDGARRRIDEPVRARHVHGKELAASRSCGNPGATSEQGFALRSSRQRDHDAFSCLPRSVDAFLDPVGLEGDVDFIGEPQQREFAQRGQVPKAEVVAERGIHTRGRVHKTLVQAVAECLRRQIDQLDLVCMAQHGIRDSFALRHARDLPHDVIE